MLLMPSHDELAYAVAIGAVARIRRQEPPWSDLFSEDVFVTASRAWPVPDFVLADNGRSLAVAAEFKPPGQKKREYLTGLGQALAYTKDFNYAILIVPNIADDQYRIAEHIVEVLSTDACATLPVAVLAYDPRGFGRHSAEFSVERFFTTRTDFPPTPAQVGTSYYAKWREICPEELGLYLRYLYDEAMQPRSAEGTIRDRAFDRLWGDLQRGRLHHWAGGTRTAKDTASNKSSWRKNYRNFVSHIGWIESDGTLTHEGLNALHKMHVYGSSSKMFQDVMARSVLLAGKHLVFINSVNEYQDAILEQRASFANEAAWLNDLEDHLEDEGLLKRNPGRARVARRGHKRQFLKAEKQLWRNLGLIVPHGPQGGRAYHPGRGLVFDWSRITDLVQQQ